MKKKKIHFSAIKKFSNVFEYTYEDYLKNAPPPSLIFNEGSAIILELACGRGEYTLALAEKRTRDDIIGVDIKGDRIWKGAKYCLVNSITNATFIRTDIFLLQHIMPSSNKVSEIWLPFPDPYLKKGKIRKRLTHAKFLALYKSLLLPNGIVHLKTDSVMLFNFSIDSVSEYGGSFIDKKKLAIDYCPKNLPFPLGVKTHYETLNISKSRFIYYLSFRLN